MNNKKSKKNKITKKTKNNSKIVKMKSDINSKNLIQFMKLRVTLIVCILAGVAVAEYILATIIYRYLCKKM